MRFIVLGLVVALWSGPVLAQVTGEVQSIGFNGSYRPNAWTPMVVRLKPQTNDAATYEIRVVQHDLDGDRPTYIRTIPLSGANQLAVQSFWMYFLPQPINKGLPDQTNGSLHDLQKELQVFLYTPGANGKVVCKLPLTSTLQNVDPFRSGLGGKARGTKLILAVTGSGSKQIQLGDFGHASGVNEDVEVVTLRPGELPEDPIGYEGVDGIVWLDGNPLDLSANGSQSFAALQDYVRYGGQLVVCQSTGNWQEDLGFGPMLPVDVTGIGTKKNFEPLRSMARPPGDGDPFQTVDESWASVTGPFQMGRATPRSDSVVDSWIDWKEDGSNTDVSPYIARRPFGLGQVTWVAQSLSADATPANATGWPYIWCKVFGWNSDAYVLPGKESADDDLIKNRLERYRPAAPLDLGYKMVTGLNLDSKGAWLIFLAIVFFLVYWIVAGPGGYAYLVTKKRQATSWFLFGASAVVATLFTALVVKLVLRGPPEIRHLSFVRATAGQPTIVYSRFGLYIPRDGAQTIELDKTGSQSVSYLAPFAEHPQQLGDVSEFPAPLDYDVPVRDLKSESAPALTVDYRSSLKKFQSRWVGDLPATISGAVKLDPTDTRVPLSGVMTNGTGVNLTDVYLAFRLNDKQDWMIYIPDWKKGVTYDIKRDLAKPLFVGHEHKEVEGVPADRKVLSDELAPPKARKSKVLVGWAAFFFDHFHRSAGDDPNYNDDNFDFVYPMLSLYDRLPPMFNRPGDSPNAMGNISWSNDRAELLNRGARMIDAAPSIGAGRLVVLATAKGGLPVPVQVDGSPTAGDGQTFYQFILPLDRGEIKLPSTQPAR